jgi:hypothetical protein
MPASETIAAERPLDRFRPSVRDLRTRIIEFRGAYEILNFDIGRTNDDPSRLEMRVNGARRRGARRSAAAAHRLRVPTRFG